LLFITINIDMRSKCKVEDCKKYTQGKTEYCVAHGGGARCKVEDCKKSAIGKTEYCKAHGGGSRCKVEDCKKSAQGKTEYCAAHGGGARCKVEDCKKSAQGKTDYCKAHGGGARCKVEDCNKSAQGKTEYCAAHGGGARCKVENCKKSARGKTEYCAAHGGGARCPYCIDFPDSRSGCKKYDGYCATCFKNVFPKDPRSKIIRQKSKEDKVRNFLNIHRPGFIHDTSIHTEHCDCTHRRRIDHRLLVGNTLIAVETDERQHRSYKQKDQIDRYDDLYMIHSGKWIFIRFNPDSYIDINGRKVNPDLTDRLFVLLNEIDKHIERATNGVNNELVEIYKLYYDN